MRRSWILILLIIPLALLVVGAGCGKAPTEKVFVLGIDGITFDLLIPWAEEGKLPNFAQLLEESNSTQLVSTIPPISPPAWTSAVTGVNPGKHGVFGFVKEIKTDAQGNLDLVYYTSHDRMADPLWVILSERNRRSVIINIPSTSPPDKLKGIMISGFPHTSLTNFTYPPEYRFKIPDYRKDSYGREVSIGQEKAFLEDLNDIMKRRARLAFKLMEEERWDLFFVVFMITDWVQHFYWKFMDSEHPNWDPDKAQLFGDTILMTYQQMDRFLGELRSRLDSQTTLIVMSDHGFGPVHRVINGQNFLDKMFSINDFRIISAENWGANFHVVTTKKLPNNRQTHELYQRTKVQLKRNLEQLKDPTTGQRVIQNVYDREEVFWGDYVHRAPDILSLEKKGYLFWNWKPSDDGEMFLEKGNSGIMERSHFFSGYHRMNGMLIISGANTNEDVNNFDAHIMDIAPTILYLLGEPVPDDMDGKILSSAISEEYIAAHKLDARWDRDSKPRREQVPIDSTEAIDQYIEEQLRAIGYVQ